MSTSPEHNIVHVVIAIIKNSKQEVLVSERKPDAHLGGFLEFPGGKVENNETPAKALMRELAEELNIDALSFSPLMQIPYSYSDRNILLDTYLVKEYVGEISGNEKQNIYWKNISSLNSKEFPAANHGVIRALQLPTLFPVTPSYSQDPINFLINFEKVVSDNKIKIIQLRSHELEDSDYVDLAKQCIDICRKNSVKLILNRDIELVMSLDVSGIHLSSERLLKTKKKLLTEELLIGASCHNQKEIEHANALKLDYIFIGPVIEKNINENIKTLSWSGFSELAKRSIIPAYAIGGLSRDDVDMSNLSGGNGVAAIRSIWPE